MRSLLAGLLCAAVLPLHAVELSVLSARAVEPGIRPALVAFERENGHTVRLEFAATPALRAALRAPPVLSAGNCSRRPASMLECEA